MAAEKAIVVRNATKQYDKAKVLDDLNLSVFKGSIYGLLGASGCGKTTLLSCVVGVRHLDSGEISVLGGSPGSKGSGIPGPRVGYMPQEISLVGEFSVIGVFYYFGRINGMEAEAIEERYVFLKELLQLPPKNHIVKNMSGGQQRRLSFAAAMIHRPELLILDEPTCGVDPILRDNIWNHLVEIAKEGTTVVITTHYIEETKQANRIGLMRCGKLLAESSPNELLEYFQTETLEEVFFKLSEVQAENQRRGITTETTNFQPNFDNITTPDNVVTAPNNSRQNQIWYTPPKKESLRGKRYKALVVKNFVQFINNPGGLFITVLLPILQVVLFFNAIGLDPKGLKISVVNEEAGNCNNGRYLGNITYNDTELTCDIADISCKFLNKIDNSILTKVFYDDLSEGTKAIKSDYHVGVIHFGRNFSKYLQAYIEDPFQLGDDIVYARISISLDMGDRQLGLYTQKVIMTYFMEVLEDIAKECNINPKYADLPIHLEDPIFGSIDEKYTTFVAPCFILTLVFFLPVSICASTIIADRHAGVWDRSLVQGVTTAEILNTHILTHVLIVIFQAVLTICLSFLCFELECQGSMASVTWLVFLEGICGMTYGFLISVWVTSHTVSNFVATGTFYPLILLGGCIWPIEGMPKVLRWISMTLPVTLPATSLRGVLSKGYALDKPDVYTGFIVVLAWICVFFFLCLFKLRSKSG